MSEAEQTAASETRKTPAPLNSIQRRILGVLMEKARTTPDVYPLSLNGLVTGCNQKSSRHPLMNLSDEQVEDALIDMRQRQVVAEVHGGGRVAKFRHYGYDYMGVKGVEAAVMTELLLRGEQTVGELRTRASRFEPIADIQAMTQILDSLVQKGLVIPLTPAGRGQLFSHNLYEAHELEALKASLDGYTGEEGLASSGSTSGTAGSAMRSGSSALSGEIELLRQEVGQLKEQLQALQQRVEHLES